MSLSKECQEYHLTPHGWIEGTFEGDVLGGRNVVETPNDRVLTMRCYDERTSIHSEPIFYDRIAWESEDADEVAALKEKFGDRPPWFGYEMIKK